MADLLLHCGANAVSRDELNRVVTPEQTNTWRPVAHDEALGLVEEALPRHGLSVVKAAYALTHTGARFFGLLEVRNGQAVADQTWVLGIRNAHDQRFALGLTAGSEVLVCDNLSFLGSYTLHRRHTSRIMNDLPSLIDDTMQKLIVCWRTHERRVEAYRERRLTDKAAHDLLIRAIDAQAIIPRLVPRVLQEWRTPSHEAFRGRNLWSFSNAVTEALKGTGLPLLADRTERLHRVCDVVCPEAKELVACGA
jgi:hypothetical protein